MNESQIDDLIDIENSFTNLEVFKKNENEWQKKDRCFLCDSRFNIKVKRHHW